jgi:hypothetical protein
VVVIDRPFPNRVYGFVAIPKVNTTFYGMSNLFHKKFDNRFITRFRARGGQKINTAEGKRKEPVYPSLGSGEVSSF